MTELDFVKRGANISHKHKFVWTAPAKVASRSVRDIFIKYCDLNPDWPSKEHPSNFTHVNNWPEEAGDDYIHIASIRHPYYRWLSYWKYGYSGQQHEMIDPSNGPIECLQSMTEDWINGWNLWDLINNTSKQIDFVIRAENIEASLKHLSFIPDNIEVPCIGKTDLPPISFSEEHLRQICYDRFFNDYIKFGYGKDDIHRQWEQRDMENPLFKQRKI